MLICTWRILPIFLPSVILESKPSLCGVSCYQFSCSQVGGWAPSKKVDTNVCRPRGVEGSPIEKVDGSSSCYIVTTGDVVIIKATTDKVTISSVILSWLVQFTFNNTTVPCFQVEQLHKIQPTAWLSSRHQQSFSWNYKSLQVWSRAYNQKCLSDGKTHLNPASFIFHHSSFIFHPWTVC